MIPVTVAVDDVAHRYAEARVELALEPGRERGIERIAENDAVRRDHEDRPPVAVVGAIHVAGHMDDLPLHSRRLRRHRLREAQHQEQEQ